METSTHVTAVFLLFLYKIRYSEDTQDLLRDTKVIRTFLGSWGGAQEDYNRYFVPPYINRIVVKGTWPVERGLSVVYKRS